MDSGRLTSAHEDLEMVLGDLGARDTNIEGIPMFLVLEDLVAGPAVRGEASGRLRLLAEEYFRRLTADCEQVSLEQVATALEILAAHHFDPVDGEGPSGDAAEFGELSGGSLVRAINYHNTPRSGADALEAQLMSAGEKFRAVGEDDLEDLLSGRVGKDPRPPLLPVFYEGYRNNYDVALPLLERAGLRGWFFIPTAFIDTPVSEQRDFAVAHDIGLVEDGHGDGRLAMTWDELRDISARGHVVVCHTATHCAVTDIRGADDAHRELVDSRQKLERALDREVRTLAWLYGTPFGEDERADAAVREAGYRIVFSNTKIQRISIA